MKPLRLLRLALLAGALANAVGAGQGSEPSKSATRDFLLATDHRPAATIILAEQPSENARAAAEELVKYVRKITGAELPIATDNKPVIGPLVLVGPNKLTGEMPNLKIPSGLTPELREEGFVIYCQGDRLVVAGNDSGPYYGTRYAVSELLYRLGVRWFMPGEFGEIVPTTATLKLPAINIRQAPAFRMRDYWEHYKDNMGAQATEWKIHHKMNPRMHQWFGVPSDSSIREYMPPKKQVKEHPDWFALRRDGTRDENMPCMTSTGMISHFVARVKADARAGKPYSAFAPDDGMPRCYCGNCQRLANGFDGYGANDRDPLPEASISNEWFYFVNAILDQVNEEFPTHKLVTNGYANCDIPPELREFNRRGNLVVMFANICACTLHAYDDPRCWQMQRQGEMLQQWGRLSDKVWIYNYSYTMLVSKFTMTPMVHRLRRNIPLLREWNLLGFHDQDEADWSLTGIPSRLVRAALEWDTSADVDALLKDFYSRWFGPSAAAMKAYYDQFEEAFEKTTAHGHEDVVLNSIYTPKLMRDLEGHLRKAERLATDGPEKAHVHLEMLMFNHVHDYVAMETLKRECRFGEAAELADRLVTNQQRLHEICPFLGYEPYAVYGPDWEAKRLRSLAAKIGGTEGTLLAMLPQQARGRTDPFDDGRYERWQAADYDDSKWKPLATTVGWENQGFIDPKGHAYRGVTWYRMAVEVPESARGKKVYLLAPAVVNEVWVWVNGQYAGHRPYEMSWLRPQTLELEVGSLLRPGNKNQLTFRVFNNIDVFGASGIYERMFLYSKP